MLNSVKKKAALILAFAMLAGVTQTFGFAGSITGTQNQTVYAAEEADPDDPYGNFVEQDGIHYTIYYGEATVSDADEGIGEAVIPAVINEAPVKEIGGLSFNNKAGITKVTIPDSVTAIRYNAFFGAPDLVNVEIPDSVTVIEQAAFCSCKKLESVKLPAKLKSVSESEFANCYNLKDVKLPDSMVYIYTYGFQKCNALESINFPEGLKGVFSAAFSDCTSLTDVELPDTLNYLGLYAFANCTSLKNLKLSNSLNQIPARAFYNCTALETLEVPESVDQVDENAFFGCTSLKTVTIPASVKKIGKNAFGYVIGTGSKQFDVIDGFTIKGEVGSEAQAYADANNITFVDVKTGEVVAPAGALKGDVDGNGSVTAADLVAMINVILGKTEITDSIISVADMDDNGTVNILDLIKLKNQMLQ